MTEKHDRTVTRRSMIGGGVAAAAGAAIAGSLGGMPALGQEQHPHAKVKTYTNADFYGADGTLLVEKARDAYYDMFQRFHYPISETLKKEMWILDFGLGDFAQVGMAGIFWLNRQDYNYFGHEIYLLPGQMIPEHCHQATAKGAAKMESWQPRKGMIHTFGEGDPTPGVDERIPPSHKECAKARNEKKLMPGELNNLDEITVSVHTRTEKSLPLKFFSVCIIQFIAVTVTFLDP